MKRSLYFFVLLIFMCHPSLAQTPLPQLFHALGSEKSISIASELDFYEHIGAIKRYQEVAINREVAAHLLVKTGDSLMINIFEDIVFKAGIHSLNAYQNEALTVRAGIKGHPLSWMILSSADNRSLGTISIPETGQLFRIISHPEQPKHYLLELDAGLLTYYEGGESPIPLSPQPFESEQIEKIREVVANKNPGPQDHAVIDVMIVYTPAARIWANTNESGILNTVAVSMEIAQMVSENSQLGVSFRLAHSREVDYQESTSPNADLRRLTATATSNPFGATYEGIAIPGFMNEVHEWRQTYGADLVAMLASVSGVGGLAWQLQDETGRPDYGFSLTRVQQTSWTYTMIHELGHNMGAHHHKEQRQDTGPGPGVFTYSAGWRWTGNDGGRYVSVMSYEAGQYYTDGLDHMRTPYFSNPLINYQGNATGHPQHGDNARTIREMKHVLAAYRQVPVMAVQGKVRKPGGGVLPGARVEAPGAGALMFTDPSGGYAFPFLQPGKQVLRYSHPGYYTLTDTVDIVAGTTFQRDVILDELVDIVISGRVLKYGGTEGLQGARVSLTGDQRFSTATDAGGYFSFTGVSGGLSYRLMVIYPGHKVLNERIEAGFANFQLAPLVMQKAFPAVESIEKTETGNTIRLSWDRPSFVGNYRHDSGSSSGGLGFNSGADIVMGGVHRRHALIESVTWSSSSTTGTLANVRIYGLSPSGLPDRNRLLYEALDVPNFPGQWSSHRLPEPLHAPDGFFVGVGARGSFFIATDEAYFRMGTNFLTSDVGRFDFQDVGGQNFQRNFFVRAHGYDFGPANAPAKSEAAEFSGIHHSEFDQRIDKNGISDADASLFTTRGVDPELASKNYVLHEPTGYNVFLQDMNQPYATGVLPTQFLFQDLPHGRYLGGVQVVYKDGLSALTTIDFFSGPPSYRLEVSVVPENAGIVQAPAILAAGRMITINAIPYSGYVFSHWEDHNGNIIARSPRYILTMPGRDLMYQAHFIDDPQGVTELRVFPNPASTFINIVAEKPLLEIRLDDITGRRLITHDQPSGTVLQIQTGHLRQGLYLLSVLTEDGWITRKISVVSR